MKIIEITEGKLEKMGELTEKMLKYGGKLMSCISEMGEEHGMHFRGSGSMGYRDDDDEYGRYGKHSTGMRERYPYMNYRDDDDEWEDEMSERRGGRRRRSNGRYY